MVGAIRYEHLYIKKPLDKENDPIIHEGSDLWPIPISHVASTGNKDTWFQVLFLFTEPSYTHTQNIHFLVWTTKLTHYALMESSSSFERSLNLTYEFKLQIKEGLIIYVCFLKGATESIVEKLGKYYIYIYTNKNIHYWDLSLLAIICAYGGWGLSNSHRVLHQF